MILAKDGDNCGNSNETRDNTLLMLQEAIAVIIDIGHSLASSRRDVKPGFLVKALQCASLIVKRKVIYFFSIRRCDAKDLIWKTR